MTLFMITTAKGAKEDCERGGHSKFAANAAVMVAMLI